MLLMTVGGSTVTTEGLVTLYSDYFGYGDISHSNVPSCLQDLENLKIGSGKVGNRKYAAGATLGLGLLK